MYVNPNKRGNMSIEKFYEHANDLGSILGKDFILELFSSSLITFSSKSGGYATIAPIGDKFTLSFVKDFDSCVFYYDGKILNTRGLILAAISVGVFDSLKSEIDELMLKRNKLDCDCIFDRKEIDRIDQRFEIIDQVLETIDQIFEKAKKEKKKE